MGERKAFVAPKDGPKVSTGQKVWMVIGTCVVLLGAIMVVLHYGVH